MKFFYDFEFYEDGTIIEPISLGIVSNSKHEIYFINKSFPDKYWTPWLIEHVQCQLNVCAPSQTTFKIPKKEWNVWLYQWLETFDLGKWDFVGYYANYDHVCLAQLFGKMSALPHLMPMWSYDLKQWLDDLENPEIPFKPEYEHNALSDARWNRNVYNWLSTNFKHPAWNKS